jgi:hypothetical protein
MGVAEVWTCVDGQHHRSGWFRLTPADPGIELGIEAQSKLSEHRKLD